MRFLHPFLLSIILIFFFSQNTFSQSSLFQDAKDLAKYWDETSAPSFQFTIDQSEGEKTRKPSIKNFYSQELDFYKIKDSTSTKSDQRNYNKKITLKTFGDYLFSLKDWGIDDTLKIFLSDTTLTITNPFMAMSEDSLGQQISDPSNKYYNTIYFFYYPDFFTIFKINDQEGDIVIYEKDDQSKYREILYILNAHSSFNKINSGFDFSFKNVQTQYAQNPYLRNVTANHPLKSPDIDDYISGDFLVKAAREFPNYFYKQNPWYQLLYSDSLDAQETVSFKDVSTGYRNRIVTSQKELADANSRINETSRSKNFLSAKTVAVGLSDFIAERAQEELNLTFFNRFKHNMRDTSELTLLFPKTKILLEQFEISNYKTLLSHARESFTLDLDNLGLNFSNILKLNKYRKLVNSSDVYNLSLIYNIADLAYQEVPVENILISSFQKLRNRTTELNKNINIEVADALANPQLGNKNALDSLSMLVNNYLNSVEENFLLLKNLNKKISSQTQIEREQQIGWRQKQPNGNNDRASKIIEGNLKLFNKHLAKNSQSLNSIIYNKTKHKSREYSGDLNYFYRQTISANLNGQEYYGFILNDPRPEDYEVYFKNAPNTKNEIVVQGIERTRELISKNFGGEFELIHKNLNQNFKHLRETKAAIVGLQSGVKTLESKIEETNNKFNLIKKSIEREIDFWETITQKNKNEHLIAGLYFLNALMENDEGIKFIKFHNVQIKRGLPSRIEKEFGDRSSLENIQASVISANERLDSILVNFEYNVDALLKKFGDTPIYSNTYQDLVALSNTYIPESTILSTMDEEQVELLLSYIKLILGEDTEHTALVNSLNAMEKELEEIENEQDRTAHAVKINQLKEEKYQLAKKVIKEKESAVNIADQDLSWVEVYEKEQEMKEKKSKIKVYQNSLKGMKVRVRKETTSNNIPDSKIKDQYKKSDNSFYDEYKHLTDVTLDDNHFSEMDMFEQEISKSDSTLTNLKTNYDELSDYLLNLDRKYASNLIEAHENASNLAKGIEISTHLLFAFRDYQKEYDTLYVEDSIYLKVTTQNVDSFGITNILTADSLRVIKKPIEGTTEKTAAARWITRKDFAKLQKNEKEWNMFLGLLYQQLRSIDDAPDLSPEGVVLLATKFLSITHDMDTYMNDLRRKKAVTPDLITFKDYYPFIRSTVDLFNTVITTQSLGKTSSQSISKKFNLENIPFISNEALSLYENIYVKEYGNAVLNAMELLKIISKDKLNKKERAQSQRATSAVLTYGTFMANMIRAKTSDQIKNILKSATLPPGSSRIKRETISSFTINSYLGAGLGRDHLLNVPGNIDLPEDAFGASLSVPIGFTYSFSPNWIKNNSSLSIHVPLLDLGAVTAYRQNPKNKNYNIDNLPDFSWNNLFAPGIFAVYNFANSPFSLGFGGQYGPQLRQIKIDTGEAVNVNSWRFPMAFFTIDVPFFNLHTGARKIIVK